VPTLLSDTEEYRVVLGDCIPHMMEEMPPESVDFSIFSPPFPALYSYTSLPEDVGNSEGIDTEARMHLGFFYRGLSRVLKPGRCAVVHVMQIRRLKRSGQAGTHDFRGLNIRTAERAGLIYETDIPVTKNPQTQAIRTKSRTLQFAGIESDRAGSFPALPDYLIKFRAPGENRVPIDSRGQVSRNEWIDWAEGVWTWHDIRQTDTLNAAEGRSEDDTKHICPLQLGVIERCVRLWSNPGEVVFSPFAGIGSELYQSLLLGRRAYGCELKPEYHQTAIRNCERAMAERDSNQTSLFAVALPRGSGKSDLIDAWEGSE